MLKKDRLNSKLKIHDDIFLSQLQKGYVYSNHYTCAWMYLVI
jgi:hypothetical protein